MKIRKTREDKEVDIISDFVKELDLSDDRIRKRLLMESSKQELFQTFVGEEFLEKLAKGTVEQKDLVMKEKQSWWKQVRKRASMGSGLFLATVGILTTILYLGQIRQGPVTGETIYSQHRLLKHQVASSNLESVLGESEEGQTEGEVRAEGYVIRNSDRVYLDADTIKELTYEQMEIAMYEISARHGRRFYDCNLQAYFGAKDWYQPMSSEETYSDQLLNEMERSNVILIKECMDWYENENNVVAFDYSNLTIDDMRECLKKITFSDENWENTEDSKVQAMFYDLMAAGLIVDGELRIRQIGAL